MVKEAGGIIKHITVYLTEGDQSLQRIAERMLRRDHVGNGEGKRSPEYLESSI